MPQEITTTEPRPPPVCRLRDWRPWPLPNAALLGHATVTFNSGWTINSIPIFARKDGTMSAGPPSMPVLDKDGRHKIGGDGKRQYAAVVVFESNAARELWNTAIIGALRTAGIDPAAGEGA